MNAPLASGLLTPTGNALARPLTLLILALGGEGGGVLADWIVDAAIAAGYPVQGTSVPGVAQRTGATSYYIEMLREPADAAADPPVFCLSPTPGQIDLLISSELLETARALERGLADPHGTLLISSTAHFLTVAEKMQMGDGRYDDRRIADCAAQCSRRAVFFDMAEATRAAGTVISAVMFGAIAASGVLPLTREQCEAQVRAGGRGVEASLRGFAAGYDATRRRLAEPEPPASPGARAAAVDCAPTASALIASAPTDSAATPAVATRSAMTRDAATSGVAVAGTVLLSVADLPPSVAGLARHGVERLIDHQDEAYAADYLAHLHAFVAAETEGGGAPAYAASTEAARSLALWMAYEDVIRVADLKSRTARFERIGTEVGAQPDEPLIVRDFLKPGVDEIAAILPPALARRLTGWAARRGRKTFSDGIRLQTSAVSGLLLMRLLASLRRWRRRSSRFADEQALIARWSRALLAALRRDPALAREIAACPQLIKGYSDTFARGRRNFVAILDTLIEPPLPGDDAALAERGAAIARARSAARADPEGRALAGALGRPAPEPRTQVIRFVAKKRPGAQARGTPIDR